MWLGSGIAVAVAVASSCSSDVTPGPGISICHRCGPKEKKKKKKATKEIYECSPGYKIWHKGSRHKMERHVGGGEMQGSPCDPTQIYSRPVDPEVPSSPEVSSCLWL